MRTKLRFEIEIEYEDLEKTTSLARKIVESKGGCLKTKDVFSPESIIYFEQIPVRIEAKSMRTTVYDRNPIEESKESYFKCRMMER